MIARLIRFVFSAFFFAVLSTVIVLAAALSAARTPGPLAEPRLVVIEKGIGTRSMAQVLESQGVVVHRYLFLLSAVLSGDGSHLQAGEYEFPAHASVMTVLNQIASGRVYQRKLTIPEGLSTLEIIALVNAAEGLSGEIPSPLPAEGTLLPETYSYVRGETRGALVARMVDAMDQAVKKYWAARSPEFPLPDINAVITLASIVEKETGVPSERPRVAAVFLNRLKLGMKLQSDPTVIYAITKGAGPLGRALLSKDLEETRSPYNTYMFAGLPPGPIANPGLASLEAVFNSASTDDLYFVADGTGGHAFARNLDEHNANVARWRSLQKGAP